MRYLIVALMLWVTPTLADEQVDFLSNALRELQKQRNDALDEAVNAKSKMSMLVNALTQAQQRIKELEAAASPKEEQPK